MKKEIDENLWPDNPVQFLEMFQISAKKRINTEELKTRLREILDDISEAYDDPRTYEEHEAKLARSLIERRPGRPLV